MVIRCMEAHACQAAVTEPRCVKAVCTQAHHFQESEVENERLTQSRHVCHGGKHGMSAMAANTQHDRLSICQDASEHAKLLTSPSPATQLWQAGLLPLVGTLLPREPLVLRPAQVLASRMPTSAPWQLATRPLSQLSARQRWRDMDMSLAGSMQAVPMSR